MNGVSRGNGFFRLPVILLLAFVTLATVTALYALFWPWNPTAATSAPLPQQISQTSPPESVPAWMWVCMLFLSVSTSLAIFVAFYLYRWRRLIVGNSPYLVPEQWAQHLELQRSAIRGLAHTSESVFNDFSARLDSNSESVSGLAETFMTLRRAIDEKDSELRRYKRGYDNELIAKFLTRFIRLDMAIKEEGASELLVRLSQDALDQSGVDTFYPALGTDFRTLGNQVADNPKTIVCENPQDDFRITEVREPAYLLRSAGHDEVLVAAKVVICRFAN